MTHNPQTHHKVVIGDSRSMKELEDRSVHLVVTSPPYWQLKDYDARRQIGFSDTYEEYINNLNCVWKECYRVLHDGCRLCINIGDQFARSVYYGRYKVIPIRTEIIRFCETMGFDYMGAIIWQKVTTCNTTGGASVMGSFPYPRNGVVKIDYEFVLLFKKPGRQPRVSSVRKEQSKLTTEQWNEYFNGHWNFPGERQNGHMAMFPEELPKRLLKMFSFIGETVLDPFLGSGTTSLAALNNDRHSVGYELNAGFLPLIREKLGMDRLAEILNATFGVIHSEVTEAEITRAKEELPYRFSDPVRITRRADPRKLNFGSRVKADVPASREDYYRVKAVLSPEVLVLDTGQRIRLLGVDVPAHIRKEAVRFLEDVTSGQRVSLALDKEKFDHEGNLLCYLYLKNRTFINAHLIKKGLARADQRHDYREKDRFCRLGGV